MTSSEGPPHPPPPAGPKLRDTQTRFKVNADIHGKQKKSSLWSETRASNLDNKPCGWLTNVVTQKFGIFAMSSDLFWKKGWRNLLYFCSTFKISSLACSLSLEGEETAVRTTGATCTCTGHTRTHLSISFCTSSMCSIASCCSFSRKGRDIKPSTSNKGHSLS